tara:strand:+ start:469 stop:579 length:111 start_codon:yes stop_codon:yes gene_type:complete
MMDYLGKEFTVLQNKEELNLEEIKEISRKLLSQVGR